MLWPTAIPEIIESACHLVKVAVIALLTRELSDWCPRHNFCIPFPLLLLYKIILICGAILSVNCSDQIYKTEVYFFVINVMFFDLLYNLEIYTNNQQLSIVIV